LRVGIHLPQYGRAASPSFVLDCAVQAEALGFADVWVSDHIAVPDGAPYPPPFIYDPLTTLTWAASATSSVGLGTSVLVLPYRHPVALAKQLATLDLFSGGRLILGAATGWLEGEFDALDVEFGSRGVRTDDTIRALRDCWEQRVVSHQSNTFSFSGLRLDPRPARPIPILIGGTSASALRRATELGDGWHGIGLDPADLQPITTRLRSQRGDDFTISMRVSWDGISDDPEDLAKRAAEYSAIGVDHLMVAPSQSDPDSWSTSVQRLAAALVSDAISEPIGEEHR
jgi:probable F420-dependent oxidoreductase